MLEYLHVKNLALIRDSEMTFSDNLNILTGETGAGKSILMGSINLALGEKASSDMIRTGTTGAYVELIFREERPAMLEKLAALDVIPEEGRIIISRKLTEGRSQSKINGETVTNAQLRAVSELLIDIHGQHDHQSLLKEENHILVLDEFGKSRLAQEKADYLECYRAYRKKKEEVKALGTDDEARRREIDFLTFQLEEIREAGLKPGEEEALIEERNRLSHGQVIAESLSRITGLLSERASEAVSEAVRLSQSLVQFDPAVREISSQLTDIEGLLTDVCADAEERLMNTETDDGRLEQVESRLEKLNGLKKKYGGSAAEILETGSRLEKELNELIRLDENKEQITAELEEEKKKLIRAAKILRSRRIEIASDFEKQMEEALQELNFLDVHFRAEITETSRYTANGADEVCFMISVNPGSPMKPLAKVASGGELSRIMLAIKALTATADDIGTLIFDEIDTGISGKTAAAVAVKMERIAKNHQVICISHLPQIAAMADHHFLIEKNAVDGETVTSIQELNEAESDRELARLLGTGEITDNVLASAGELRKQMKGAEK